MKEKYGEGLDVNVYTLYSEEAKAFALQFKGSTNVFFNKRWVPLDVAIDKGKMEDYLSKNL